ncbi:Uma2 family endonuclease [Nocardioides sp.]|uniref:Uma2 family endonuclease n=1 Tax=Nocardioides sp. TaxID=35761 RepID=UPI0039E27C1E
MVHAATNDQTRFTGIPLLCVEITSGNWTNDLILKRAKYAAARLHDYWVVDRRERVLRQYVLQGDLLAEARQLDGRGMAEARFAGRSVSVDLDVLFPTP